MRSDGDNASTDGTPDHVRERFPQVGWSCVSPPALPPRDDVTTRSPDVVVVGAGVVGLMTALLLQRAGRDVVVLEARNVTASVTAHSTVKVTVGHGTLYSVLTQRHGIDTARAYAEFNQAGMAQLLDLAGEVDTDCMLSRGDPHVVYAETEEELASIEAEADVCRRIGVPVERRADAPLPFDVAGAVAFLDQASFHPGRYLAGLATALVEAGGTLVQGVRATAAEEGHDGCVLTTTQGRVTADVVVVATQTPFLDRGGHFAWLEYRRSYGVAGVLPPGVPAGMTINVGSPTHSTRTVTFDDEQLLIIVGEGHPVGHVADTGERWDLLRRWGTDRFGVGEWRYHWSAEETSSLDKLPFAGLISPVSSRIHTATAFDGWGMTNGTASAMLIRDLVLGYDTPFDRVFDARRAESTIPGKDFIRHNVHIGKTWLKDRLLPPPDHTAEDLQPGDAAIIDVDGHKTAAYRDEDGTLHAVSSACSHMSCDVEWNDGETSWDCPCHGSRFSPDGDVLHGPASAPLQRRDTRS